MKKYIYVIVRSFILFMIIFNPIYTYAQIETILKVVDPHPSYRLAAVDFSPDSSKIVIGGSRITVYDLITKKKLTEMPWGGIWDIEYSSDGKYILSSGQPFMAKLWDAETGAEIKTFRTREENFPAPIYSVAFHPTKPYIFLGDPSRIELWDLQNSKKINEISVTESPFDITVYPDGEKIFVRTRNGAGLIIESGLSEIIKEINGLSPTLTKNGTEIIVFRDNRKYNLDSNNGSLLNVEMTSLEVSSPLVFSSNGKYIVMEQKDSVFMIDLASETQLSRFNKPENNGGEINFFKFSPDVNFLAEGYGNQLFVFDISKLTSSIPNAPGYK